MLLQPPAAAASVRYPWFDQLSAFFGPERVAALRSDPMCMVKTAVVHAVLQAETALADVYRDPPASATRFLIMPMVVVNHEGPDDAIVVGVHDVKVENGDPEVIHGTALRSTPEALTVSAEGGRVTITSDEGFSAPAVPEQTAVERRQAITPPPVPVSRAATPPAALARLEDARVDAQRLAHDPHLSRVYARPILRGLLQGLSVLAPEVALAAMAFEGGRAVKRTQRLRKLLAQGPSTDEARRVLHDVEAEIQQLGHREAQEVLELLTVDQRGGVRHRMYAPYPASSGPTSPSVRATMAAPQLSDHTLTTVRSMSRGRSIASSSAAPSSGSRNADRIVSIMTRPADGMPAATTEASRASTTTSA
jgi:hypothetical protein